MATSSEAALRVSSEDLLASESEVAVVFHETLGLIRLVLIQHYQIWDWETTQLEKDLSDWFRRFCVRPGAPSARDSRPYLLLMCCAFARGYQKQLVATGARETNEKLNRLLEREPSDVAGELSRRPELLYCQPPRPQAKK